MHFQFIWTHGSYQEYVFSRLGHDIQQNKKKTFSLCTKRTKLRIFYRGTPYDIVILKFQRAGICPPPADAHVHVRTPYLIREIHKEISWPVTDTGNMYLYIPGSHQCLSCLCHILRTIKRLSTIDLPPRWYLHQVGHRFFGIGTCTMFTHCKI